MLKKFLSLLLFIAVFSSINLSYASGIKIVIPEKVFVNSAQLTLGDIADISGDDDEKISVLKKINLGSAPLPGNSMILTNELLGMRMSGVSLNYSDITWYVPDNITITANSQTITGQELLVTAQKYIKNNIAGDITDYTIDCNSLPQDIIIRPGDISLKAVLPYGVRYNVPTNVVINVMSDDLLVKKVELRFNVKRYEQVVALAKPLLPNQIINNDDLNIIRMDISKIPQGYIKDRDKIVGKVVLRILPADTVINTGMLYNPIIITKSSTVNIIYQNGSIEVTASGTAIQDGREGETIRVQNEVSKKIVSAVVVDKNTVVIKGR